MFGFVLVGAVSQCEEERRRREYVSGGGYLPDPPIGNPPIHLPRIAPDREYALFVYQGRIVSAQLDGGALHRIPSGPSAPSVFTSDAMPDISPDGSRVVYSTHRHYTGGPFPWNRLYSMEIATSKPDGGEVKRLTKNEHDNVNPAWSPDGGRIAFASKRGEFVPVVKSTPPESGDAKIKLAGIYTINADGSDERLITMGGHSGNAPDPIWSPDGGWIAFRDFDYHWSDERASLTYEYFIALVGADGSGFKRIAESDSAISIPAWSPDGRYIAFRTAEDGESVTALYSHDVHENVTRKVFAAPSGYPRAGAGLFTPYAMTHHRAAWTSDGSKIVFYDFAPDLGFHIVNSDGTGFRKLPVPVSIDDTVGWALDGARLMLRHAPQRYQYANPEKFEYGAPVLRSVNLDGTDEIVFARYRHNEIVAARDWEDKAPDCESGIAVTDPKSNPGLVRDCEILLSVRDRLGADSPLNWQPYHDIRTWDGIRVGGSPLRVEKIEIDGQRLGGVIPAQIGGLTELKSIFIPSSNLSGEIPPELGNLANLEMLHLIRNQLTGSIPPELGNLVNLKGLYLSENLLTGSVPPELSNLINLEFLTLHGNDLSGCIPASLANIENIQGQVAGTGLDLC